MLTCAPHISIANVFELEGIGDQSTTFLALITMMYQFGLTKVTNNGA